MNRGDILAKLQSTSAAETRTLSITDAAIQNKNDATNALNVFDAQSVFKLISSANDLEHRFDLDKEFDSTKNNNTDTVNIQQSYFDMHATTKNKRKNFKPRNATAVDDMAGTTTASSAAAAAAVIEPSLTDQLMYLMMQNKMKQIQQELHQGQFKRWNDIDNGSKLEQQTGDSSDRINSNNNEPCNVLKSPPSSPLANGHSTSGGKYKWLLIHIHFLSAIFFFVSVDKKTDNRLKICLKLSQVLLFFLIVHHFMPEIL